MRIGRRRGVVRLEFDYAESDTMAGYLDALEDTLSTADPHDPVRRRLFPAAHRDDAAFAAEFRELTQTGLQEAKLNRVGLCRAELPPGGGTVELDPEATDRWLRVLNDLRLALGVRLDVGEDEDPGAIDPDAPDAEQRIVYHWLGGLQAVLLETAMGG